MSETRRRIFTEHASAIGQSRPRVASRLATGVETDHSTPCQPWPGSLGLLLFATELFRLRSSHWRAHYRRTPHWHGVRRPNRLWTIKLKVKRGTRIGEHS